MKKLFSGLLLCALMGTVFLTTGCGGGGGGGGSAPTATAQSATTISGSVAAKNFIAREVAGTYSNLDSYSSSGQFFNLRANKSVRATTFTQPGFGQGRIIYDTTETVNIMGVNYTYHSGYQDLILRDSTGNLTENENLIDSLEINSVNMGCRVADGQNVMNLVYNGKLIFLGFTTPTSLSVRAQNLNISGTVNGIDQINWTINGNVTVNESSYPYPVNGSTENGTLIFNGHTYNYSTKYNGTNIAQISFSGAETFTMQINLATGAIVTNNT